MWDKVTSSWRKSFGRKQRKWRTSGKSKNCIGKRSGAAGACCFTAGCQSCPGDGLLRAVCPTMPLCAPSACCCQEILSSFLRVATVSVNPAATSDFLLLAAASSPLGAFWGQR